MFTDVSLPPHWTSVCEPRTVREAPGPSHVFAGSRRERPRQDPGGAQLLPWKRRGSCGVPTRLLLRIWTVCFCSHSKVCKQSFSLCLHSWPRCTLLGLSDTLTQLQD